MWMEARREERVRRRDWGGEEMWKRCQLRSVVSFSCTSDGTVRFGRGEEGLWIIEVV